MGPVPPEGWHLLAPALGRAVAVFTGCAAFRDPGLPPLPQTPANVAALAGALTGENGLFAPGLRHTVLDPHQPREILGILHGLRGAETLLFFYTGHGIQAQDGQLALALTDSVDDERQAATTGLPVGHVFTAMRASGARHLVAVLDCCYAERAFDAPGAAHVHVLAAAGRTERAWSLPGAEHSRFAGALAALLAEGVADGPELLDLATVYRRLATDLAPLDSEPKPAEARHQVWPHPRQHAVNASGDLAIARNPAFGTARTAEGLVARARFATRMRRAGREGRPIVARLDRLAQAERLFAAIAADAAMALHPDDPLLVRLRHAHASTVGDTGRPREAYELLTTLVRDAEANPQLTGNPWLKAARASRDHWRNRSGGVA